MISQPAKGSNYGQKISEPICSSIRCWLATYNAVLSPSISITGGLNTHKSPYSPHDTHKSHNHCCGILPSFSSNPE